MKLRKKLLTCFLIGLFVSTIQAQVRLISATKISIDARYDSMLNKSMSGVLASYKARLGKDITRPIGECDQFMTVMTPEGLLSDFLADQLLLKACQLSREGVDLSVINLGSIRAPLKKGILTVTDIYKVMPFENELVILELKGSDIWSVFKSIARTGGAGVSNVNLEIKGNKINKLLINGESVDNDKLYRVATMDYLADGNSGMTAFLHALKRVDTGLKVRDVFIEQIEKLTAQGKKVDARLDGRIKLISE